MHGHFLHGNRETREAPRPSAGGRGGASVKEQSRRTDVDATRESDGAVVPKMSSNNGIPVPAETAEERASTKRNVDQKAARASQHGERASIGLAGVRQKAIEDRMLRFTNLKHHLTPELLWASFYRLNRHAAPGLDGMRWSDYAKDLDSRLADLHDRLRTERYRATPVLRTYIAKTNGGQRPLGKTCVEDKIVQQAVVTVLMAVYDADMYGFSYGFRPEKSPHMALDALAVAISRRKVNWIVDADVQSFFDEIPHDELLRLIDLRIGDRWLQRLILKWLKTGYSEEGVIHRSNRGTPQGSVISPLLANIYLHYVLDDWVHHRRKTVDEGDVAIVRYADDFVLGFQHRHVAEAYLIALRERFAAFGLRLHPDKTRLLEFGRYASSDRRRRGQGKPETFDFLGFTHICSTNRKGWFLLRRHTVRTRLRRKVKEVLENLRKRMHRPVHETGGWLGSIIRGFVNYYGVPTNNSAISAFRDLLAKEWIKVLRRRSQKGRGMTWVKHRQIVDRYLPHARICHPFPNVRFDARYSR